MDSNSPLEIDYILERKKWHYRSILQRVWNRWYLHIIMNIPDKRKVNIRLKS